MTGFNVSVFYNNTTLLQILGDDSGCISHKSWPFYLALCCLTRFSVGSSLTFGKVMFHSTVRLSLKILTILILKKKTTTLAIVVCYEQKVSGFLELLVLVWHLESEVHLNVGLVWWFWNSKRLNFTWTMYVRIYGPERVNKM